MKQTVNIGIIADYDPNKSSHTTTNAAIEHAARHLKIEANINWLPTPSLLTEEGQKGLTQFDAIWAGPGGPYKSRDGAIRGIRIAREMKRPFLGT
jgi:CTP synthase (UTP-ammonia lyase)